MQSVQRRVLALLLRVHPQATAASGLGGNEMTSGVERTESLRRFGAMAVVVVVMFLR
jgi:hypothetical protein